MNKVKRQRVLELLDRFGPLPGLSLVKRSEHDTGWFSRRRLRRGAVYVLLCQMEDAGLIVSRRLPDGRRIYELRGALEYDRTPEEQKFFDEESERVRAMFHPTGECTCAGDGTCDWCVWRAEN